MTGVQTCALPIYRVYGHHRNLQNEIKEKLKIDKEEDLLPIIYDLSEVYDLWFVRK